jgi:hypothetical protein
MCEKRLKKILLIDGLRLLFDRNRLHFFINSYRASLGKCDRALLSKQKLKPLRPVNNRAAVNSVAKGFQFFVHTLSDRRVLPTLSGNS